MKRSYGILLLAGGALLAVLASGFTFFSILLYVLVGLWVGSYLWALANLWGIHITAQRKSGLATVGEIAESELHISNRSPLPKALLEVRDMDGLPGQLAGTIINLPPYQDIRYQVRKPLSKRGVYQLGPALAVASDPFGLFRLERSFPGVAEVTVYPSSVELPHFRLFESDGFHLGAHHQLSHNVTPAMSSVREYSYGDSLRHIHWPSTARTSKFMVKEFESELRNEVWMVLDMHQDVQVGPEIDNTEETSVSIAVSIMNKFFGMGISVGLVAQGDQYYLLSPQDSPAAHEELMSTLAVIRAEGKTPLSALLGQAQPVLTSTSNLVIITPSSNVSWVHSLGALLGRGGQIAVVLVDAHSFGAPRGSGQARNLLQGRNTLYYVVRQGDDLGSALNYRAAIDEMGAGINE